MATHGDALRKAFPWHWAVILGTTRMFPKVGDDFMIFHVTSTQSFEHRNIIWGTWWIFCSFFRCPKLRNWPPDATAIEKMPSGHHRFSAESASVRDVKRTLWGDDNSFISFVGRTFSQRLPEVGGDLKHSQALNYVETLFCSTILQDQFFL